MPEPPADADEGPHRPGRQPLWAESWDFDFAAGDGSLGGYVRLGLYPNLGAAWYWAALVGIGRSLVAVRDHDVPLPRRPGLEVRTEGLWSALTCETPHDHWSIGLEAFAVSLDDPGEAYGGERGDRVALGLDLEWEATAPVFPAGPASAAGAGHYEQACLVYGEVLVGEERLDLSGSGQRIHRWGVQDWWAGPLFRASGRLGDGRFFAGSSGRGSDGGGYLSGPGGLIPLREVAVETVADRAGLPVSAALHLGDLALGVTPLGHAPLRLDAPDGRVARLARSLCRLAGPEEVCGVGWCEWLRPPAAVPATV